MISILIPIFNFDCRQLVNDLSQQCEALGIDYEVICFDDGSEERFKKLHQDHFKPPIIYREMSQNLGRSAIRNALAKAASNPYLLFMDCDSKVVRDDFMLTYFNHLKPDTLLYGGRCYSPKPFDNQSFIFHWTYGKQREQSTVEERERHPWHSFMTNNFLIPKAVFEKIGFDETLKQYGHEDTLFGLQLAKNGTQIKHLDNPLEHLGLEPARVFLNKTALGLQNLHVLWERKTAIQTKLLTYFVRLKKWRMSALAALIFKALQPVLEKQLQSKNPSLRLFDFYKLGYLCWWDRQQTAKNKKG